MILRNKGLSFVELVMAIGIVGLIAALGLPNIQHFQMTLTHHAAVHDIENLLQLARHRAINANQVINIQFKQSPWCMGVTDNSACDCHLPESCTLNGTEFVLDGRDYAPVTLTKSTFSDPFSTQFSASLGTAFGQNGSLTVSSSAGDVKVIVSSLGRTRICAQTGAIWSLEKC